MGTDKAVILPEQTTLNVNDFIADTNLTKKYLDIIESYKPKEFIDHREDCAKCKRYHFGDQWDEKTRAIAKDKKQYIITIPKIKDIVNQVTGLLTAEDPAFVMSSFGQEDFYLTKHAQKLVNFIWKEERGNRKFKKMIKMGNRDNIGYLYTYWDSKAKMVKLRPLPYDKVIIDPESTDSLYEDAEYIWIEREVSSKTLKDVYKIEDPIVSRPITWGASLVGTKGNRSPIEKLYNSNKNPAIVYEGFRYFYDDKDNKRVHRVVVAGYGHVYEEDLPEGIDMRGIVSHYAESNDTNPLSYGVSHFLLDIQDMLNTAYATMLYNAQVSSNTQTYIPEELIPMGDIKKFEENATKPGAIIPLSGDMERMQMPIFKPAGQLAGAWYTIVSDMFNIFESKISADISNWTTEDSNKVLQQKKQVMTAFIEMEDIVEENIEREGKILFQYGKTYFDSSQLEKILAVSAIKERMGKNVKNGLDIKDEEAMRIFVSQLKEKGMPDNQIDIAIKTLERDSEQWENLNKLLTGKNLVNYSLSVKKGSYSSTYDNEMFFLSLDLNSRGLLPAKWVIKYAPLEDKKEILAEIDELASAKRNIEMLTSQQLEKDKRINQLMGALDQTKVKVFDTEMDRRNDKIVTENRWKGREVLKDEKRRVEKVVKNKSASADKVIGKTLRELQNKIDNYTLAIKETKMNNKK